MDLSHSETWQAVIPRIITYAAMGTIGAWLMHLLQPALSASLSRKYEAYSWVKGERGLFQFFSVAYECIFYSGGLFKAAYEKVRNSTTLAS
jgi:hypothetical protein